MFVSDSGACNYGGAALAPAGSQKTLLADQKQELEPIRGSSIAVVLRMFGFGRHRLSGRQRRHAGKHAAVWDLQG